MTGTACSERRGSAAIIRLRNERARNALDDGMRQALLRCVQEAADDASVRSIIVTGSADAFSAGGELRSMPTEGHLIRARLGELHDIVRILFAGRKPTIAAVEGPAFGAGMSIAAACDVVIAGERARFGCTFGKVGLVADTGLHTTLPARVGARIARRILLGNEILTAAEAVAIGLADRVVDAGTALEAAIDQAANWTDCAPLAVAATKRLLAAGLAAALPEEMEAQISLLASADFAEGRTAFLERRDPQFTGAAETAIPVALPRQDR